MLVLTEKNSFLARLLNMHIILSTQPNNHINFMIHRNNDIMAMRLLNQTQKHKVDKIRKEE